MSSRSEIIEAAIERLRNDGWGRGDEVIDILTESAKVARNLGD